MATATFRKRHLSQVTERWAKRRSSDPGTTSSGRIAKNLTSGPRRLCARRSAPPCVPTREEDPPGCAPRYTPEQARRLGKRQYGYTRGQAELLRSLIRGERELWESMLVFEPVDLVEVHRRVLSAEATKASSRKKVDLRALTDFLSDEGVLFVDTMAKRRWKRWRERRGEVQDEGENTQSDASNSDSSDAGALVEGGNKAQDEHGFGIQTGQISAEACQMAGHGGA